MRGFKQNVNIVLYENIYQTCVNILHVLLNFEIGGFECRVMTTDYLSRVFE